VNEVEQVQLTNKIKKLVDDLGQNPHWLSVQSGLTYRVVLRIYKSKDIPATTPIGTLLSIARVLNVQIDDLYEINQS
jgi:hypothetical protein